MPCDQGVKPRKKVITNAIINMNQQILEEKPMSSTMVRQEMPKFTMDAYDAKT